MGLLRRTHPRYLVEVSSKFRLVLVYSMVTCFSSTHSLREKCCTPMFLSLSVGFLEFYTIIGALFSHNNFVNTCIESPRSSNMEDISFSVLDPGNAAIHFPKLS